MKTQTTNIKLALTMGVYSLATFTVLAGPPTVVIQVPPPPPPVVVVTPPAPAVTVEVAVPDSYVWDGVEFVGVVGAQYYYLGPGDVWLSFDSVREARFHDWEKTHADWRTHVIINEKYRRDAHGHEFARHDHDKDRDHDQGHADGNGDRDHGHDHDKH